MDLKVGNTWPETFNLSAYFVFILSASVLACERKANNLWHCSLLLCLLFFLFFSKKKKILTEERGILLSMEKIRVKVWAKERRVRQRWKIEKEREKNWKKSSRKSKWSEQKKNHLDKFTCDLSSFSGEGDCVSCDVLPLYRCIVFGTLLLS